MEIITVLVQLAGAIMLLLFAVRMVQTGIERAMGPSFRGILTRHAGQPVRASLAGVMLAIVLQSATAASLLAAGFLASALIGFRAAMATVLGADLGSALVIQLLALRPDWLIPVLLAAGGFLFLKTEARGTRQSGRILIGVALILLSLRLISESVAPLRDAPFMPAIAGYLARDPVGAYLVGAALTLAMHSSVAAILMTVTFVAVGMLPLEAGLSVIMGANLGSALVFLWLARGLAPAARRLPVANLLLRGVGSVAGLGVLATTPAVDWLSALPAHLGLVAAHMALNAAVLILSLPLLPWMGAALERLMPDRNAMDPSNPLTPPSALDSTVLDRPNLAIASLTREVLRMGEMVAAMAAPVMPLYRSGDKQSIKEIQAADHRVNAALDAVRRYSAAISRDGMTKEQKRRIRELVEYAISLEAAGDVISKSLMPLAATMRREGLRFSEAGQAELEELHERVMRNISTALAVLVSEDIEAARLLLSEKSELAAREARSRKRHLKRLREGDARSLESSDIHLETLRALKDLNARISQIAYPILYRAGQLLETRLVNTMEEEESENQEAH